MALTKQQWMTICVDGIGLRSASSETDTKGASYALDDGARFSFGGSVPSDWESKLETTLSQILGFGNSGGRKLLVVKGVHGTSHDYVGCFAKCSSHSSGIVATVDLSAQTVETLKEWVLSKI